MSSSRRHFLRTLAYSSSTAALLQPGWARLSLNHSGFEPSRDGEHPGLIRLNSNENPYGPSKKAAAAMVSALVSSNRYPRMEYDPLAESIAKLHRIEPDRVLLGCGSTEILRMAACAFLGPGKQLLLATPTFEAMERYAQATGADVVSLRLTPQFAHDLEGMLRRA